MANRTPVQRWVSRTIGRPLETAGLHIVHFLFSSLPLDAASALGGAVARAIGPRLGLTRRARRNLERIFPEMTPADIETVIREMWDNLGRVAGEMPHLPRIRVYDSDPDPATGPRRVDIVGGEHLDAIRDGNRPVIFFTAHIGNWEIGPLVSIRRGLPLHVVYRSANNPWADRLFLTGRRDVVGGMIPKGAEGAKLMLKALQDGHALGMLVDQKMNDGIAVPFLGRDAMTAPALAQLVLRFDCILLPAWIERVGGAYFRATVEKPLEIQRTGDRHADTRAITMAVNERMGAWIRKCPGQWLWLHRRWPD